MLGVYIGGAVGGGALLALIVVTIVCCVSRRRGATTSDATALKGSGAVQFNEAAADQDTLGSEYDGPPRSVANDERYARVPLQLTDGEGYTRVPSEVESEGGASTYSAPPVTHLL